MGKGSQLWLIAVASALSALMLAALVLHQSFGLGAISDLIQCFLLASGTASFVPLVLRSHGRMRLFWSLITLGFAFWLSYQLLWTYYEVVLRKEVPEIFVGDIVLFLHIVPLMAALALRPHVPEDKYAARLGRLDFILLLVWWLYLYVLIVIPWQYVMPNSDAYNHNLNALYLMEKVAFLTAVVASWIGSRGQWKSLYAYLFVVSLGYAASSYLANWAIARGTYFSGSWYDVPLAAAMAFLTWIGLRCQAEEPGSDIRDISTIYGVWIARSGMIAAFSLPLFALWGISDPMIPPRIRLFRLVLTLTAALIMGGMVLLRQHLLDCELVRLLNQSRHSFDTLKHLQAQILQSEKLASIGQLVGGAAHELNNPITAMLGYSDLLLSTKLTPNQEPLVSRIGQHVRRTKSLVASLISFARQTPAPRSPLDLNTLARTAAKLTQPQWESSNIEVRGQFDFDLPKVIGDSNQLLQVCLQLVGNCLHIMNGRGAKILTISTTHREGTAELRLATGPMPTDPRSIHDSSPIDPEDGLGLSACQGILQEHGGQIYRERFQDGSLLLRVELPAAGPGSRRSAPSTLPVQWQSRQSS